MLVEPHPDFGRLSRTMERLAPDHVKPWSGIIIRSAPPKWSSGKHMLSGIGSQRSGARFNARLDRA